MSAPAIALTLVVPQDDGIRRLKRLVLDSVSSVHSRRAYSKALDDFLHWYAAGSRGAMTKAVIQQYRADLEARGMAPSTINVRLAAVRKLSAEAADNGLLPAVLCEFGFPGVVDLRAGS